MFLTTRYMFLTSRYMFLVDCFNFLVGYFVYPIAFAQNKGKHLQFRDFNYRFYFSTPIL